MKLCTSTCMHVVQDVWVDPQGCPCLQVTETTFRRFLVDSPLVPSTSAAGVRYGSFHQQYWVNGQSPHLFIHPCQNTTCLPRPGVAAVV